MLNEKIEQLVIESLVRSFKADKLGELSSVPDSVSIELPKNPTHGDRAISIAMKLTKDAKIAPRMIAEAIVSELDTNKFSKVDIAGPGFINLTLDWSLLEEAIAAIHNLGKSYGRIAYEARPDKTYSSVLLEYVSANPTGDLHLGHGRQAVLGSALSELLRWAGYKVNTEFYINDAGAQIEKLSNSAKQAILIQEELLGEASYDHENNYPLDSMKEFLDPNTFLAELIAYAKTHEVPGIVGKEINLEAIPSEVYGRIAETIFLRAQKIILKHARTEFDKWYSERENLHQPDSEGKTKVDRMCDVLLKAGYAYKEEDALWFKAKDFGDERNRVLRKSDGKYTYLAADLAYHQDKLARGNDKLINLWGADHHGQIPGIKGALEALGERADKLDVILIQMVSLAKNGVEVKMSKRDGNVVTIRELIDEVGVDAFRYFLVESQANNRMVFDLGLATKQDKDNPVYYAQYAHARCCSILRTLTGQQMDKDSKPLINEAELEQWLTEFKTNQALFSRTFLKLEAESLSSTKALILRLTDFPEEIKAAAAVYAPYKIANYIKEIATLFHQFYTHNRVINDDRDLMKARVSLVAATQKTLYNALSILGISAPERM